MNIALWIFGVTAVLFGGINLLMWPSINRGSDNFALGFIWMGIGGISVIAAVVWCILAAVHWWPK